MLLYLACDGNSLQWYAETDLANLVNGYLPVRTNRDEALLVFLDEGKEQPTLHRYYSTSGGNVYKELVKLYDTGFDSADPDNLKKVLDDVESFYPSERRGLVLWSHASGWIPSTYAGDAASKARRSFGIDNGQNTSSASLPGHQMNIADMARVVEQKGGVDFVFFDACFMQSVEVAYKLRKATQYVIGSPAEIPGPGAYYQTMVPAMFKASGYADAMLQAYYDYYTTVRTDYGIIVSSVETSGLDNFAAYMKTVVANHQEDLLGVSYGSLLNYFHYGIWNSEIPDMYDMQGIMRQVLDEDGFASWQEEAAKVIKCYHADGWYSAFTRQINPIEDGQCCGVTMFVPLSKYDGSNYRFNESYLDTAWGKYVWQQ